MELFEAAHEEYSLIFPGKFLAGTSETADDLERFGLFLICWEVLSF